MDTSNTRNEVTKTSEASLGQDLLRLLRYWLRDRRVLIGLAVLAVAGGAFLNWGWLVAIGVAPIVLALAPCAAMCALGLCSMNMMGKKSGASCSKDAASNNLGDASKRPSANQATKPERTSVSE